MPTVGTSSKPAYVYDAGTDTWIPVGPGAHTHDYSTNAHNHDSTYIPKSLTTTTGDIVYASSANTPARLGIGSTDQVLKVSNGIPAWSTPAAASSGLTFITSSTFSSQSSVIVDGCFTSTYTTYLVVLENMSAATNGDDLQVQLRYGSTTLSGGDYYGSYLYYSPYTSTFVSTGYRVVSQMTISPNTGPSARNGGMFYITQVGQASTRPVVWGWYGNNDIETALNFGAVIDTAQTYTGFLLKSSSSNITGTVRVYGLATS